MSHDSTNFTYIVLGHKCSNLRSRKYSPCNYYPYSPVESIMNINDHEPSNLNYFPGIVSSQCPHVVYTFFFFFTKQNYPHILSLTLFHVIM